MSFSPETYGLDEIITVETEVCLPAKWQYRVNRETGTVELVDVKITGLMSNAIVQRYLLENLPDQDCEEAESMVKDLIEQEKKADAERWDITDAENSMFIGAHY
jgi:hypothetical protein